MSKSKSTKSNICLFCLKGVEDDKRCSRCRTARYCSSNCQMQHWPVHKKSCVDSNTEDSIEKLKLKAANHYDQGSFHKAENLYRKCLDKVTKEEEYHPDTLKVMSSLAAAYSSQGKYSDAEALYNQCLD